MREALRSSDTSVLTRGTRRDIPEDTILHYSQLLTSRSRSSTPQTAPPWRIKYHMQRRRVALWAARVYLALIVRHSMPRHRYEQTLRPHSPVIFPDCSTQHRSTGWCNLFVRGNTCFSISARKRQLYFDSFTAFLGHSNQFRRSIMHCRSEALNCTLLIRFHDAVKNAVGNYFIKFRLKFQLCKIWGIYRCDYE
jgi:hypothetical protein